MVTIIESGPNKQAPMEGVWVVVSVDPEGREGICATMTSEGWIPLVTADESKLEQFEFLGREVAQNEQGYTVRLLRFSNREVVRELK